MGCVHFHLIQIMGPEFSFDNFPIHDLFHFQIVSMIFPMNWESVRSCESVCFSECVSWESVCLAELCALGQCVSWETVFWWSVCSSRLQLTTVPKKAQNLG